MYRTVFFITADPNLTEDAVQEAFIKAIEKGPRTRKNSNMKAWIKQVSRNAAFDMIRKNKKYRHVSDVESVMIYDDSALTVPDISTKVVTKMLHENVTEWLHELTVEHRIVLTLHYIEEMSYKEIVEELGITEHALAKRLERARKKLAELYVKRWGEPYEA